MLSRVIELSLLNISSRTFNFDIEIFKKIRNHALAFVLSSNLKHVGLSKTGSV